MSHSNFISRNTANGAQAGEYALHIRHYLVGKNTPEVDSDYDGLLDSNLNCTTCHNVHGARNSRMIRSGELANHPDEVARYKAGQKKLMGFFVSQVMNATKGKANPKMVNDILRGILVS